MQPSFLASIATTLLLGAALAGPADAAQALKEGPSGFPLPRFVSLGSSEVNVRMGPSIRHKVKWTFLKEGLPVEVISEFGNWRRVRDADGEEGWVHGSLLSGRRTALVSPWASEGTVPLRPVRATSAPPKAYLEPFVLATVHECDGSWCTISINEVRGVVPQQTLWGVYPRERID